MAELSLHLYTRIEGARKNNVNNQRFFVKHVDIIRPLKADIFFIDYMFTGYNYQIYITSISCLITKFFIKRCDHMCFHYYLFSMFVTYRDKSKTEILLVSLEYFSKPCSELIGKLISVNQIKSNIITLNGKFNFIQSACEFGDTIAS